MRSVHCALALLLLSGCTGRLQLTDPRGDLLKSSGFHPQPANTPARLAMLQRLPPNRASRAPLGTQVAYVFPDLQVCNCLYVGDEAAYARYRQGATESAVAGPVAGWDWSAWGPP